MATKVAAPGVRKRTKRIMSKTGASRTKASQLAAKRAASYQRKRTTKRKGPLNMGMGLERALGGRGRGYPPRLRGGAGLSHEILRESSGRGPRGRYDTKRRPRGDTA